MKNSNKNRFAIFDSGVGGFTVFREISQTLPYLPLLYICDNKNFPYGPKSADAIVHFVSETVTDVLRKYSLTGLVIACNTASTLVLPSLRKRYSFPVIGVVPAIKPAAQISKTKSIGLLATPGTITRSYTDNLIQEFAKGCQVTKVGSVKLVEMAERKVRGGEIDLTEISQELRPIFEEEKIDTVVLGCTHFPLLLDEINSCSPRRINWVDSAKAIASRVKELNLTGEKTTHLIHFTRVNSETENLRLFLSSLGIQIPVAIPNGLS